MFTPAITGSQPFVPKSIQFDFYGDSINLPLNQARFIDFTAPLSASAIRQFYNSVSTAGYGPLINTLVYYKGKYHLDDWFYYQLIRKTAEQISPKASNYYRYTLYKWYFLCSSGYDARLSTGNSELLFYVQSRDTVYNLPLFMEGDKQFVCLNYHDYGYIDFTSDTMHAVKMIVPGADSNFSYIVKRVPDFKPDNYIQKQLAFNYRKKIYRFDVMVNPQVQTVFANYPAVDYKWYFNVPLSRETYATLIPLLKKQVHKMSQQQGIDFLMRFTRYAFLYEDDQDNFGKEKCLTPEETLIYNHSDCDDRAGLFFYLVKEIYNLPMITLLYPTHVTIAVKFDTPVGDPVAYKGILYSICDPTAQAYDAAIGYIAPKFKNEHYKIVYAYDPVTGK
ncbi:MAG TPA: hypothetical protein VHB48_20880 [Chitinophagaceae bacterium]|nr:hypothetical protein [Chitinophagaceae bacterium]